MLFALLISLLYYAQSQKIVTTAFGPVFSTDYDGRVTVYRSIPYAAPPVGERRFRAPSNPEPWGTPLDVSNLPSSCAQMKIIGDWYSGSEDCLYLQVYVPDSCSVNSCPVFFWIHGGGWILGDNHKGGLYEAKKLSYEENMIVVLPNYRLGPLGLMALEELQAEDAYHSTGNAALQDQRHAMLWVRDNIAYFGGDPNKVTIVGQSAGAFSVCWHLASEHSRLLFRGAIIQSGTCDAPQFFSKLDRALEFGNLYAKAVGCADAPDGVLACLRKLSTNDVLVSLVDMLDPNWPDNMKGDAKPSATVLQNLEHYLQTIGLDLETFEANLPPLMPLMPWAAVIDNSSAGLKGLPIDEMRRNSPNIPVIVGSTKDEGTMFLLAFPIIYRGTSFPPNTNDILTIMEGAYNMYPADLVRNLTQRVILPVYNDPSDLASLFARANNLVTDAFFGSASRRIASTLANTTSTYLYRFNYDLQWPESVAGLGAYHACELALVFKNEFPASRTFSPDDWSLSDAFSAYWGNFVHNLDPNGGKAPIYWPKHGSAQSIKQSLEFDIPFNTTKNFLAKKYDAWDIFYSQLKQYQQ